jgi:hypothetical protein
LWLLEDKENAIPGIGLQDEIAVCGRSQMRSSIISRTTLTRHLQRTLAVHSSSLVFRTHKESRSVGIYDREAIEQMPARAGRSRAVSMAKACLWFTYVSFAPVLAFPTSSAGSLTPLRDGLLVWWLAVGQ